MAVRIRLKRIGKTHYPVYRIVVVDGRKKRDGRVIEEIGRYNPNPEPSIIEVQSDRVQHWMGVGAQPTKSVRKLLVLSGDIAKFNGKEDAESRIQYKDADAEAKAKEEAVRKAQHEAEKEKARLAQEKAEAEAKAAKEAEEAEAAAKAKEEPAEAGEAQAEGDSSEADAQEEKSE
ncbi:MAG: 30S ribosomal protein S16 [Actinomycetaceae bacterium]|nr:30S ribosomal protein S16 [Actinomycetaceae bacterium]